MTIRANDGIILEAGCGAGRILRYFHNRQHEIVGIDFVEVAITNLRRADPTLKVETGDISNLRFSDSSFQYLLAFGLFHNLENDLHEAIAESWRVLTPGGALCASFRADNLQTRLTDWLTTRRSTTQSKDNPKVFHKLNLSRREFTELFEQAGFVVEKVMPAVNMPILYKFGALRAPGHKIFDESMARAEGYKLSHFGKTLQAFIMRFFPNQFCNIWVMIAQKP